MTTIKGATRVYFFWIVKASIYPVRNNAPLLCPVHHAVQGSGAGLDFRIIPAGFNAPLGFESRYSGTVISNGVYLFEMSWPPFSPLQRSL